MYYYFDYIFSICLHFYNHLNDKNIFFVLVIIYLEWFMWKRYFTTFKSFGYRKIYKTNYIGFINDSYKLIIWHVYVCGLSCVYLKSIIRVINWSLPVHPMWPQPGTLNYYLSYMTIYTNRLLSHLAPTSVCVTTIWSPLVQVHRLSKGYCLLVWDLHNIILFAEQVFFLYSHWAVSMSFAAKTAYRRRSLFDRPQR